MPRLVCSHYVEESELLVSGPRSAAMCGRSMSRRNLGVA